MRKFFFDILQLPSEINDPRCFCIMQLFRHYVEAYGSGEGTVSLRFFSSILHPKIFLPHTFGIPIF